MATAKRTPAAAERPSADLKTNAPEMTPTTGGVPARGLNNWRPEVALDVLSAGLRCVTKGDGAQADLSRYGAGAPMSIEAAKLRRREQDPRHARQTAHQVICQLVKKAALLTESECRKAARDDAKAKGLRSRSEVVIWTPEGILAIKKPTYLLMPGGGIDDGETAEAAAYRESIEEADRKLLHLRPMGVVEATWPADNKLVEGYDGERSYFFLAMDGGTLGTTHDDNEPFEVIPFGLAERFLKGLIDDETQAWARDTNLARMRCLVAARQQAEEEAKPEKLAAVVADVLLHGLCDLHTALVGPMQTHGTVQSERTSTKIAESAAAKCAADSVVFATAGMFGPIQITDRQGMRSLAIGSEVQGSCCLEHDDQPGSVPGSPYTAGWLLAGSQTPTGRALMIGLGAGAGVVAILANFPGLDLTVVEIDPAIIQAVTTHFPLIQQHITQGRLHLVQGDATQVLPDLVQQQQRFDLGLVDAYTGTLSPAELDIEAALRQLCSSLWWNVIDRFDGPHVERTMLAAEQAGRPITWVFDAQEDVAGDVRRNLLLTDATFNPQTAADLVPFRDLETAAGPRLHAFRQLYAGMAEHGIQLR